MALSVSSVVIPRVTLFGAGEGSAGYGGGGLPILGTVESLAPPVVCWENGTKTSYSTEAELLELVTASVIALGYYHHRVRLITGFSEVPVNPNNQGASEGLVIGIFTLKVALSGNVDFVVVQFSANDIAIFPVASVNIID